MNSQPPQGNSLPRVAPEAYDRISMVLFHLSRVPMTANDLASCQASLQRTVLYIESLEDTVRALQAQVFDLTNAKPQSEPAQKPPGS